MTATMIGNHAKLTARPADRAHIRRFYQDVLGCQMTKESDEMDYLRFEGDFFLTVIYNGTTLRADEQTRAVWLELKTEDPAGLTRKVRAFGVKELDNCEQGRLYFQAPGGQVFRIVGASEDLSRFNG